MFSVAASPATLILTYGMAGSMGAVQPEGSLPVLEAIDNAIAVAALALAAAVVVVMFVRPAPLVLLRTPPRPNRLREDAIALAVMVYLTGYVVALGLVQAASGSGAGIVGRMVTGASAQIAGIVACLYIGSTRFEGGVAGFFRGYGAWGTGSTVVSTAALALLSLGLCPLVGDGTVMLILHFDPGYEFSPHPTIDALHDPTHSNAIRAAFWFSAVVMAPLAEELFFRGLLQTYLGTVLRSRFLAIGVASIAFGAVHAAQPHAVAALALLGAFLGYAYERTGSLAPAVVIHAGFNLKTLVWDALNPAPV